jgi:chemotaxis protein methyltransferase CheR
MTGGRRAPGLGPQGARADDLETLEIELLLTAIARRFGYDFRHYSPASLKRRIRRAVTREGVQSISGLTERLLHHPDALQRFVSVLSVHATAMFRDPAFYRALRGSVVPLLRTYPFVRIWHAGCSTGEEVYSLAILLSEEGIYDRCRIYATDISGDLVERARAGIFALKDMREYTANYIAAGGTSEFSSYYVADHRSALMREPLRRHLVFSQHNLASDSSFNEFHVILCRNVMIYFDQELRQHVHQLLYDSLMMFGTLGLGMRETLQFTPFEPRYEPIAPSLRLYRRVK